MVAIMAYTLGCTFIQATGLIAACLATYCIAVAVYRLRFHPYSKIPGPFWAKITSVYSAYHSWHGDMHLDVQRCHRQYGDLIRYGPNQILTLHHADLTAIYGHGAPFRKSKGYETMIPMDDGWSTMTSINKSLHKNLRKTLRSGLTNDYLKRFEPAILRHLKKYYGQLTLEKRVDGWSTASNMRKWNLYVGFDTMSDFGLGISTNLLYDPARDFIFPTLHVHEKKMGLYEQLPALNGLGLGKAIAAVLLRVSPQAQKFAAWYESFLRRAVAANAAESRGIFGPVIQSGLSGGGGGGSKTAAPGHNHAQMIAEGSFSVFSSADAYGITLSGLFHYLGHYPDAYARLAAEMRAMYRPGEEIAWDARLESCAYLRAVVNEVMRLLPPACGVHWRECEATTTPAVAVGPEHHRVPVVEGSDVGVSVFALCRDGRVFRDPLRFWPERWMPGTLPEEELAAARRMFVPFSIGPRNCAGSHVAIMITSIAYAYTMVNYDFRFGAEQLQLQRQPPAAGSGYQGLGEPGEDKELRFESHYSIAGWENGPFIEFKARESGTLVERGV